jgi:hypothetical protein
VTTCFAARSGCSIHRRGMLFLGEAAGDIRTEPSPRGIEPPLRDFGVRVTMGSVDPAVFCPAVARELQKSRQGDLFFAPVAPSERLRARAGRSLPHARLVEAMETALRGDWPGVRIRYVLGMPGETPEDREEALDLLLGLPQGQDRELRGPGSRWSSGPSFPCAVLLGNPRPGSESRSGRRPWATGACRRSVQSESFCFPRRSQRR